MNGVCLTESLIYYVSISCNNKKRKSRSYKGSCGKSYADYKKSFNAKFCKKDTMLSNKYCNLKNKQINHKYHDR